MKKTIIVLICVVVLLVSVLIVNSSGIFIDEEQRISEIKEDALIQAKEYIREALVETSEYSDVTISALDNLDVAYGVEALDGKTYTATATYKYRLELSHVQMDIYYVCEIEGDLRTNDVTVTLLDYYTSDPVVKVDPKQLFTSFCNAQWATYESNEHYDRIVIDTNPNDDTIKNDPSARFIDSPKWYIKDVDIAIQSINDALNLPLELRDKIVTATHLNPGKAEKFVGYIGYSSLRVSFAFHPNKGLIVIYEFSK